MTNAVVATVPPTRPMNWLANCTAVADPSGMRCTTEPSMAIAWASWGVCDRRKTTSTHQRSAPWRIERIPPALESSPTTR